MSETDLLDWIAASRNRIRQKRLRASRVAVGVGDDCAVIRKSPQRPLLLSADMIVESVHFDWKTATPYQVGWKAMASNLSDVAAMGGIPTYALVSIAAPKEKAAPRIKQIFRGIDGLARKFDVEVVGGDLSASPAATIISIAIQGYLPGGKPVLRSGGRPGHQLFVSGSLGGSSLGRHLRFSPRIELGQHLQASGVSAMMDLSDGLSLDLHRLARASGVGAQIEASSIPISRSARRMAEKTGKGALHHALCDGEDFELLFSAPRKEASKIVKDKRFGRVTRIGELVRGRDLVLLTPEGEKVLLESEGYDHFRR